MTVERQIARGVVFAVGLGLVLAGAGLGSVGIVRYGRIGESLLIYPGLVTFLLGVLTLASGAALRDASYDASERDSS